MSKHEIMAKPVKLYTSLPTPNGDRVKYVMAEKNLDIPIESVNLRALEHRKDEFKRMNPWAKIPVLLLDDGSVITETIAIAEYFELLQHKPCLFGHGLNQVKITEWIRRIDLNLSRFGSDAFHHHVQFFPGQYSREYAALAKAQAQNSLELIENQLGLSTYIATDKFSMADIVLISILYFLIHRKVLTCDADQYPNIYRWLALLESRSDRYKNPYTSS